MRFKSLGYVFAAAFLLAACESTTTEQSASGGDGGAKTTKTPKRPPPPVGFSITPGSAQDLIVNVGDRVFFGFDKSSVSPAARSTLEKQAAWLKKFGSVRVTLEGHADERGTREYNLALGERRANAAKDFLVALGISSSRVRVISYGKERPVALGHEESSWKQNRRAVTMVTGAGS